MERMFVYPETLESKAGRELGPEDSEYPHAELASYRCKLYRTLLEQRTASRQWYRAWTDNEQATGANA